MAEKRRTQTSTYGSLAYDLDALVRERQLEEAGTMPERRHEVQQPKPRTRAHAHTQAKRHPAPLLLGGIALLVSLVMVLMLGYVQLTKVSNHVSGIKSELAVLADEHVDLLTQYEKAFDLATIKEVAENAGMSKPSAGQIEYIDLSGDDNVVIYRAEADSFFQNVRSTTAAAVDRLLEYFR